MAARWQWVGPPLRPSPADTFCFNSSLAAWKPIHAGGARALIFGVTPELYSLHWPVRTRLLALDSSEQMIAALWPGDRANALLGTWTAVPLGDHSQDLIVLDGGFGVLSYPEGQRSLLAEVARVLSPGGLFIVRLFAPAGKSGSLEDIGSDLRAGRILSLDALKLRIWGALQSELSTGVRPRDVVMEIEKLAGGDVTRLASDYGWSPEHVSSLEFHRHSDAVYHLADVEDVQGMLSDQHGLALSSVQIPEHEFGESCPVITLQRHQHPPPGKNPN